MVLFFGPIFDPVMTGQRSNCQFVPSVAKWLKARDFDAGAGGETLAAAGGGGTGAMVPPLAREGGAILSFGPTFDVKGKR